MNVNTGELRDLAELTTQELQSAEWVRLTPEQAMAAQSIPAQERMNRLRDIFRAAAQEAAQRYDSMGCPPDLTPQQKRRRGFDATGKPYQP